MLTRLREALSEDMKVLWQWRNDPLTRSNSFHHESISLEEHARWFAGKLMSVATRIYLLEDDASRPLAQVRYERRAPGMADVHITVAPDHRGKGYGKHALAKSLSQAMQALRIQSVEAAVKEGNTASMRMFLGAGFQQTGQQLHDGERYYVLRYSPWGEPTGPLP